jgi:hypothetical protein
VTRPALSLSVVGADFPNSRGPGRRFEIAVCVPGEPVHLRPEPKNPADPRAVAVDSDRGVCIGYLSAERCGLIGKMIAEGREVRAVFQRKASYGAVIRVAFDGEEPTLAPVENGPESEQTDRDFWPDPEWPD